MPSPKRAGTGLPATGLSQEAGTLLETLESARDLFARQLVQEYLNLPEPDLNAAILASILQVLFLKTGQERGFVKPGTLALLAESEGIGKRMARACSDAGLPADAFFERGAHGSRPAPVVPDDALREFIRHAGSGDFVSPLSRIPPADLAVVFEHFFATRLQVAEGYRVKRAPKSAVIYTGTVDVPAQPVVDHLVKGALTGRMTGAARGGAPAIRILDPACGAGVFLLAAYRFLARQRAQDAGPEKTEEILREVLCRSVYGTDIDPESASAARLLLLLAFIGDCRTSGSGAPSPAQIRQAADCLTRTIRCGNAVIAPDYFSGRQEHPFNAGERQRVNAFSWQEAFPEILAGGGFDAVIGAPPPYRPFAVKSREEYFQTHYDAYAKSAGLYGYFIEKSLSLIRPAGTLAFLVPEDFLRSQHARPLRLLLLSHQILSIENSGGLRLLRGEEVKILILRISRIPPARPFTVSLREISPGAAAGGRQFTIDQRSLDDGGWSLADRRTADLLKKLGHSGTPLDQYVMGQFASGTQRIKNNPFAVDAETRSRLTTRERRCHRFFAPLLRPADIRRYVPEQPERFLVSVAGTRTLRKCRALRDYLRQLPDRPAAGPEAKDYDGTGNPPAHIPAGIGTMADRVPKLIFARYQHCPMFTVDTKGLYAITAPLTAILRSDPYLAAILNSSLARFLIPTLCPLTDRGYTMSPAYLGRFPVVVPDFDKRSDRARHDRIVALVAQVMSLHEYIRRAKTGQEKRLVQQEIDATDVKIDALVYELYGLTAEEIAVIEAGSP